MPIACKVCDSDKKESIEEMILQGYSNLHIANTLKDMSIDISHASINRHKNTHMIEHAEKIKELATPKCNIKYDRNNNINEINAIDVLDKALKNKSNVRKFKSINDFISKVLINQITIVIRLQEKFMNGECKYPYEEIRGLHIINDIMVKFELFIQSLPNTLPLNSYEKSLYKRVMDINDSMINGKISIENANKLLNGLSISAKIFEIDELEKRLSILESKSNES